VLDASEVCRMIASTRHRDFHARLVQRFHGDAIPAGWIDTALEGLRQLFRAKTRRNSAAGKAVHVYFIDEYGAAGPGQGRDRGEAVDKDTAADEHADDDEHRQN